MTKKFIYFAIGWSIFGILATACQPVALWWQTYFQFRQLGMDSSEVARKLIVREIPLLIGALAFCAAGLCAAFFMLRRKNWARLAWIALWALSVVFSLPPLISNPDSTLMIGMLIRIGILAVSVRVLCSEEAKQEFAPAGTGTESLATLNGK